MMPSEEVRQVIELGGSKVVSMPKPWLDYWGIKEGNAVSLLYNNLIVIFPPGYDDKEKLEKIKKILEGGK